MDGKRYRIQGANTLSLPAEDAEKLLALAEQAHSAKNRQVVEQALEYVKRDYRYRCGGARSLPHGRADHRGGAPALRGGASHRRGRASAGTGRAAGIPHGGHIAPQRR